MGLKADKSPSTAGYLFSLSLVQWETLMQTVVFKIPLVHT